MNQLLITIEAGIPTYVEGVLGHELQFVLANCLSMMHKPLHEYQEIFLCTMNDLLESESDRYGLGGGRHDKIFNILEGIAG